MFNKIYENTKKFIIENYKTIIIFAITIFVLSFPLPYMIYKPGGVVKLNDRIKVEEGYNYKGELSMSYVSMVKGTLPTLGLSYIFKNWDIVPKSEVTYEDESLNDLITLEKLYMKSSIENATILAFNKANKKVTINKTINNVVYVSKEAKTDILKYDEIISVDGKYITNIEDIKKIVGTYKENDKVNILVKRDGKEINTSSTIYKTDDGLKLGISTLTTYDYETDPKVSFKTKNNESGSSGGLMLSLAIYNELIDEDITKGKHIVGTGTIETDGTVGAIDGVKYKILGAVKNKADLFICPKENYEEAIKAKEDNKLKIDIVSVETFDDALKYLKSME
ncbi:MAG: S16 family serine protease [Bacilli bacterium]